MTETLTPADYKALAAPKGKGRFPRAPKDARTWEGIVFDSKREMLRWPKLRFREIAGTIHSLKRQITYRIELDGQHFCKYTPDSEYITDTGAVVYEDTKSSGTRKDPAYRLRKKAFEIQYKVKVTEVLKP